MKKTKLEQDQSGVLLAKIIQAFEDSGDTYYSLAQDFGESSATIGRILKGESSPVQRVIMKLVDRYGIESA